ncbi:hypothetical protein HDU93_006568, partial [Gonapodya sp. JEL0774]
MSAPIISITDLQIEVANSEDAPNIKLLWNTVSDQREETVIDVSSDEELRRWIHQECLYVARIPDTPIIVGTIRVQASNSPETVKWILGQYELDSAPLSIGAYRNEKTLPEGRVGQAGESLKPREGDYAIYIGTVFCHPNYRESGLSRHLLQSSVLGKITEIVQLFEEQLIKRLVLVFSTDKNE